MRRAQLHNSYIRIKPKKEHIWRAFFYYALTLAIRLKIVSSANRNAPVLSRVKIFI